MRSESSEERAIRAISRIRLIYGSNTHHMIRLCPCIASCTICVVTIAPAFRSAIGLLTMRSCVLSRVPYTDESYADSAESPESRWLHVLLRMEVMFVKVCGLILENVCSKMAFVRLLLPLCFRVKQFFEESCQTQDYIWWSKE